MGAEAGALMSGYCSFETTVRGGMPVEVHFLVAPPELDVGILDPYIEDIYLEVKGKRAKWLEKYLSFNDWEILEEQALLR
jgi:hypothetical protein